MNQTLEALIALQNRLNATWKDETSLLVLSRDDIALISYALGGFTGALLERMPKPPKKAKPLERSPLPPKRKGKVTR